MIGIYEIYNKITYKSYIGSSTCIEKRKSKHFQMLSKNKHINKHLQASYNKHGKQAFEFKVIQETTKEDLLQIEQFWIDFYNACRMGYNILPSVGTSLGSLHSQETKNVMALRKQHTWYGFIDPGGNEVIITNLRKFCRENNLNSSAMFEVYNHTRRRKSYKGWTCKKHEVG